MFGKFRKPSEISKSVDDNRDLALKLSGINDEAERQFHQPHVLTEQEIRLKSFCQPGETFLWLGIAMTVSRFGYDTPWSTASLICDYVDKQGVIHEKKFSAEELPALLVRNQESSTTSKKAGVADNPAKVYEPIKKEDRLWILVSYEGDMRQYYTSKGPISEIWNAAKMTYAEALQKIVEGQGKFTAIPAIPLPKIPSNPPPIFPPDIAD